MAAARQPAALLADAAAPASMQQAGNGAMPMEALCVSIHDVAPATWDDCLRLHDAVRAVADIPLTWLVVPCYRRRRTRSRVMEAGLEARLGAGHELALHGYTHSDDAPGPPSAALWQRWTRNVFAQREGEFAALDEAAASARIALGRAWFSQRGWPLAGFVAPAWLLGPGGWRALHQAPVADPTPPFLYTTTLARFHWLASAEALWAPSLVYAARNGAGRVLSPRLLDLLQPVQRHAPLVRLGLHPRDARHPALMRHMQRMLARLLLQRDAMTKHAFALAYQYGPQKPPPRQRPGP